LGRGRSCGGQESSQKTDEVGWAREVAQVSELLLSKLKAPSSNFSFAPKKSCKNQKRSGPEERK
jgi:hypothetical protein